MIYVLIGIKTKTWPANSLINIMEKNSITPCSFNLKTFFGKTAL